MAELPRALTRLHATALVVGSIIGAGIFVQPSEIARHLDSPAKIMLVWASCGVLTLFGALVCAELASAFPRTGGLYVFLRDTFSPLAGFLWGWAMFWTMHSGIIAAIAMVFARYAGFFLPPAADVRVLAVLVIVALTALNYFGVKAGGRVLTVLAAAKLVAIVAMVALGLALAETSQLPVEPMARANPATASDFLLAMVAGLFAYGGWHMVTYTAGETMMPSRAIPVALTLGVAIVTACYIALNLVYLTVLPLAAVRTSTHVAADAAESVIGPAGSAVIAGLVMLSTLGTLTGLVLAGPRVYYSMAQDGLVFRWLAHVHPTNCTPARAIVAQGVWCSILAATGAYRALFTRVIYTEWLFFALMTCGLFVLRRNREYNPPFRSWGYPVVPIVFILASLVIVANQIYRQPLEAAVGLGLVAAGVPLYYLLHARH